MTEPAPPTRADLLAQRAQYVHDLAWARDRRQAWLHATDCPNELAHERRRYWARRIVEVRRGLAEIDRQLAAGDAGGKGSEGC